LISQGYQEISQWYSPGDVNRRTAPDGKTGLEVLLLIIENGLNPTIDENQGILAGPLIADLLQKVPPEFSVNTRRAEKCNPIYKCY
jgi:hypothetical protein